MTDGKADMLHRFLTIGRIALPLAAILLVVLQWWQNSQLMDEARSANELARKTWTDHPSAFPLDTLAAALYIPAAVSPLGAFDAGDGPWLGQSLWLQLSKTSRAQDQIGYDVFPAGRQIGLSAAMFAQIAIPSLAVLLGWIQVRRKRSLSLQSWATLQISLIEYAGPIVALSCLLTAALQPQVLGLEGAIRLMLLLGSYVLYSLAAGSICWIAFHKSSSLPRSTGFLVLFWLCNFSLARPFTINLGTALYPLPSLDQYARNLDFEIRNGYNGVEPQADRQRRFINEALRDYNVQLPSELKVNLSAIILEREERHQREVGQHLKSSLEVQFLKQERLEQVFSLVLPLVAIQISSSALAATDFASEREQLRQADAFWSQMVHKVYADVIASSGPDAKRVLRGAGYWRQFPFLEARLPGPAAALNACFLPALGLFFCALAGIIVAFRSKSLPAGNQEIA